MFSKILIANRGEIAVRIIRACKEMGIATVAVFSEADRDALHVSLADESVCIGPAKVQDSYLNMPAIISAAVKTGAQAIHPGYGLLSENARFAKLCEECHISFIGPNAELISKLGDKDEAKRTMRAAGVPVVPGSGLIESEDSAAAAADQIGFPLLVKARAGGGGRGIRLVNSKEELIPAFRASSQEADSAFGDGACYLEKYLEPVKHIEMQILCDDYDNVLCLGERDCSVQRKHQKLLEESPATCVTPQLREKMMEASQKAAKAVHYRSLGTIEYLVDNSGNFYFMEMNTRVQVEHAVTEMVTGVDLIETQITIAMGLPLSIRQEDIILRGNSLECRINAENPEKKFAPCPGRISHVHFPGGNGVRVDSAIYDGYTVPSAYDSLIAKVIVHGKDRETAIRRMCTALDELVITGISTNINFQYSILHNPVFCKGKADTGFIEAFLEHKV
ncbi:MAG TPA: acetyl-CoA carboxylase biotin carboxylase subunit [Ruminococcaceae bacterium]|nr:acetyl-CoA carboxylase biotin carboxylase subunit [Oscillospiraceae bacterium]